MVAPFVAAAGARLVTHGSSDLVLTLVFTAPALGLAYLLHRDWPYLRRKQRQPLLELSDEGVLHRGRLVARFEQIHQVRLLTRSMDGNRTLRMELILVEPGCSGHTVASLVVNGLARKELRACKALIEQRSPIDWDVTCAPWWRQLKHVITGGPPRPITYA